METVQSLILGIIQGLTEFLPVSSSGHLVICQHLFGLQEAELFFDICVHAGTLIAVIIFFRKDIRNILLPLSAFGKKLIAKEIRPADAITAPDMKPALLIVVGSVPTAIIGLFFHNMAEQIFSSVFLVGCTLMITGTFLWFTRKMKETDGSDIDRLTFRHALCIGFIQGLAILPGISRSGSTIAAGLFLGLKRETAARYSFLLSIPAIGGALLLGFKDMTPASVHISALYGAAAAGIVGYCALVFLVFIVKKGHLFVFAPYCWLMGAAALIYSW